MQSVQHIAASKTVAQAFVDSVSNTKAFGVEGAPVDLKIAAITLVSKDRDSHSL